MTALTWVSRHVCLDFVHLFKRIDIVEIKKTKLLVMN